MNPNPLVQERLFNQKLAGARLREPEEIVGWLGAVQAQDYSGGKWSLGLRGEDLTDIVVERDLEARRILRTWTLRGTLHFVAARDIRWLLGLLAPRVIASNARRYRELELDEALMARAADLLEAALSERPELLRSQLLDYLRRQGISTQGQRAPYLLQWAALEGRICQVGVRRNDPVYILLAEAIPAAPRVTRAEAAAELARRYFSSHGPASLQDFTAWSGLLAGDARAGLEAAKTNLVEVIFEGKSYWRFASDPEEGQERIDRPLVCLLPGYDEFLLGYSDRSAMLDPFVSQSVNLGNGMSPTFAIDGRIAGIWRRTIQRGKVLVKWTAFQPLDAAESQAISGAVARYAAFLGLEPVF